MKRLLIIGCGDVVSRALPWLVQRFRVYATARNPEQRTLLRTAGVIPINADLDKPYSLNRLAGLADLVLHSAPPSQHGVQDTRTRHLLAALSKARKLPSSLIYISTSGVYGNCDGSLVPETTPLNPSTDRARRRADAEQVLRCWGRKNGISVSILRVPGIYASNRLPLERLKRGDPVLRPEEDVYTNHVHAEDLARATVLALFRGRSGRTYNISDDSVLKMGEFYDFLADSWNLARPPRISRKELASRLSALTISFMSESRRLANERMKRELRVKLIYPTVDAGIKSVLTATRHKRKSD